jgi:[ribosomal protein S18]-alanine N-acetyltransferase
VRGLAIVWTVADEAQLLEVAVHPAWRRRGVGAALVAAVLARAPAGGSVVLEVAQSNDAAHALYASYGFEETGRRKGYYRDGGDAVLMARRVGE